jgi:transcriptional regulator with XRE-family HTH domain
VCVFLTLLIKEWREIRGISQKQLAKQIGMSQSYLSRLEANKKNPSLETLHKIADILNVKPCQLYICHNRTCQCEHKVMPGNF